MKKNALQTERLLLTPIEPGDVPFLLALLREEAVRKYLCDDQIIEQDAVRGFVEQSQALFSTEAGIGLWLLRSLPVQEPVGLCGFLQGDDLEILYVVGSAYTGRGLATEASRAVLERFQNNGQTADILAVIDRPNLSSHFVARKLGTEQIGTRANPTTGEEMSVYRIPPHSP